MKLKNDIVYWPSQHEHNEMKDRFLPTGFRQCVVIINGTLIILHRRPGEHFECHYSRKSEYASHCTVVCNDNYRVTIVAWYWHVQKQSKYFGVNEYLFGDSAYSSS